MTEHGLVGGADRAAGVAIERSAASTAARVGAADAGAVGAATRHRGRSRRGLGGAAAGAAIGNIVPSVGTAVGALAKSAGMTVAGRLGW